MAIRIGHPLDYVASILLASPISPDRKFYAVLKYWENFQRWESTRAPGAMTVREVFPDGRLGPRQDLWLQHFPSSNLHTAECERAGVIVCCHPQALPSHLRPKHAFPDDHGAMHISCRTWTYPTMGKVNFLVVQRQNRVRVTPKPEFEIRFLD